MSLSYVLHIKPCFVLLAFIQIGQFRIFTGYEGASEQILNLSHLPQYMGHILSLVSYQVAPNVNLKSNK